MYSFYNVLHSRIKQNKSIYFYTYNILHDIIDLHGFRLSFTCFLFYIYIDTKYKSQTIYMHNIGLFFCFCQVCFNLCLRVCSMLLAFCTFIFVIFLVKFDFYLSKFIFVGFIIFFLWGFVCLYVYHCGCCWVIARSL